VSSGVMDIFLQCKGSCDSVKLTAARSLKMYTIRMFAVWTLISNIIKGHSIIQE